MAEAAVPPPPQPAVDNAEPSKKREKGQMPPRWFRHATPLCGTNTSAAARYSFLGSKEHKGLPLPPTSLNDADYTNFTLPSFDLPTAAVSAASATAPDAPPQRSRAKRAPKGAYSFDTLPPEVLSHVLSYLKPRELARMAEVSKWLFNLQKSGQIWRDTVLRYYGGKHEFIIHFDRRNRMWRETINTAKFKQLAVNIALAHNRLVTESLPTSATAVAKSLCYIDVIEFLRLRSKKKINTEMKYAVNGVVEVSVHHLDGLPILLFGYNDQADPPAENQDEAQSRAEYDRFLEPANDGTEPDEWGGRSHPVVLEDLTFHPIVNLATYKASNMVTFLPPRNTSFQLMRFRATRSISSPVIVHSGIEKLGENKFSLVLRLNCVLPSVDAVSNSALEVRFADQDQATIVESKATHGKVHWKEPRIEWRCKSLRGGTEAEIRVKFAIASGTFHPLHLRLCWKATNSSASQFRARYLKHIGDSGGALPRSILLKSFLRYTTIGDLEWVLPQPSRIDPK